jgi:signal transduction histidine kinase
MKRMIDQLLDFTRVRMGGGLEVVRGSFDLGDLVKELVRETEQSSGREFQVDQRGDLAGAWDRDRLGQVLSNLLTNAADHGLPERPIRVRVDGTEPARVTIETNNLGQIPSDLLPTLFEPFRVGAAHRPMGRGLGLGLFIAREVVRLHGGGICVFSTAEEGTTFQVELPRSIS